MGQRSLTEGGWGEQPLDVQAGLSPREGQGTEPRREEGQGWGLDEACLGAKNPKLELDLPGPYEDICQGR